MQVVKTYLEMGKDPVGLWRCAAVMLLFWRQSFLILSEGNDAEVLLRLKSWMSEGASGPLASWNSSSSSSLCSWPFISCLSGTRNIETIDLAGKGLKFSLRDGLGSLTKLRQLNLSFNDINGEIPNDFSCLFSLETLDLSNNQIQGAIPRSFGALPNLQILIINGNLLCGLVPNNLCNAPRFRSIVASNNQLIECMHGEPLTKESEVYSFGVFVFELLTRQVPEMCMSMLGMPLEKWVRTVFPSMQTQVVDYEVLQTAPTEEHVVALLRVALSCTEEDPKLRPRISKITRKLEELSNLEYVSEQGSSLPPVRRRFAEPIAHKFHFFR